MKQRVAQRHERQPECDCESAPSPSFRQSLQLDSLLLFAHSGIWFPLVTRSDFQHCTRRLYALYKHMLDTHEMVPSNRRHKDEIFRLYRQTVRLEACRW